MKRILGILSLVCILATPAIFFGCSDEEDPITKGKDGVYFGSVTMYYYDTNSSNDQELISEYFAAYVVATSLSDDMLNLKVYRKSHYCDHWVVKGSLCDFNSKLEKNSAGFVGDNDTHIYGETLMFNYDIENPKQVEGRTYFKAKFNGVRLNVNTDFKDELDPVGEYRGTVKYDKYAAATEEDWSAGNLTLVSGSEEYDVRAVVTYDVKKSQLVTNIYHIGIPEVKGSMPQENYDKLVCGGITFNYDGSMEYTYTNKEKPNVHKYVYTAKKVR